jgi:uncharacterized membrane protein
MEALLPALTVLAALGAGLVAGIFFAFSTFIMAALARLPAEGGIAAMQSINVAVFIAALSDWSQPGAIYLLAGALLYLIGTILVTIAFNMPLNNILASAKPSGAEGGRIWTALSVILDRLESCADSGLARRGCIIHSGPTLRRKRHGVCRRIYRSGAEEEYRSLSPHRAQSRQGLAGSRCARLQGMRRRRREEG